MASKQRKKPTKRSSRARSSLMMSPYAQLIIGVALIAFALYFVIIIHKGAAIHTSQISSEMGFVGAILYKGIRTLVGQCEYFVPLLLAIVGLRFVRRSSPSTTASSLPASSSSYACWRFVISVLSRRSPSKKAWRALAAASSVQQSRCSW